MASGLAFLTYNPASEAYRDSEQRSEQRRAADLAQRTGEFNLAESQRRSTEEQRVDRAYREGMTPTPAPQPAPVMRGTGADRVEERPLAPPPGSYAADPGAPVGAKPTTPPQPAAPRPSVTGGVADRLAQTPGGGRAAFQMRQQQEKDRDQQETNVFRYLSNPNTAHIGMSLAERIGMQIPKELSNNVKFWQATDIAKQLYPDDMAAAQKFTSGFLQSGGQDVQTSVSAGIQAAGAPVKKRRYGVVQGDDGPIFYDVENPTHQIAGPQSTQGQFMTDGNGNTVYLRKGRTQAEAVTGPDNQPLRATPRNPSVFGQKYQAWLAAHPGDHQGALGYAQGTKQLDAATEQRIATEIVKKEMGNPPDPTLSTPAQRQAYQDAFGARVQDVIGGWRSAAPRTGAPPAGAPAAQPAQTPAAPSPAPAQQSPYAQYPGAQQAPDGRWYVQQGGQWFMIEDQ